MTKEFIVYSDEDDLEAEFQKLGEDMQDGMMTIGEVNRRSAVFETHDGKGNLTQVTFKLLDGTLPPDDMTVAKFRQLTGN